ncbi:hypothetical protein CK203_094535 [Vitis vinifera]|uniref:Uncharacterized protein n=1 Tax=Vitis vinifera TaxID=29760 RepID=A0A438D493_VITVI|nr:hypothetical protein CK203_094535 [Vitis vinifera]
MDQQREQLGKEASEVNALKRVSDDIIPHILNLRIRGAISVTLKWRCQIKPQQLVLSLGSWWIIDFVDSTVENAQNESNMEKLEGLRTVGRIMVLSVQMSPWCSLNCTGEENEFKKDRYAVVVDMIASKSNIGEVRIEGFSVEAFKIVGDFLQVTETKTENLCGFRYGACAAPRDFEIYAPDATFEDPLMCAHGVKQIKSAFYSLSKVVFNESKIVEYSIKENLISSEKTEILMDNKQHYKFLGRGIDMISLIKLHVEGGKVVRHEDWWDKKPLLNRETAKLPLVGRIVEMTRRGSMLVTHVMMRFGKDPTV